MLLQLISNTARRNGPWASEVEKTELLFSITQASQ